MKILFAIPHYFYPKGGGGHGSLGGRRQPRAEAMAACLASLHNIFGKSQMQIDFERHVVIPANQSQRHQIEMVVCTTGNRHLLGDASIPRKAYQHRPTTAEPALLGFECQQVFRESLGEFDYYCYLEDDLLLNDPWFFFKLAWFSRLAGAECLLQPNRFEMSSRVAGRKVYIDGYLQLGSYSHFRDLRSLPEITAQVLDEPVIFRPARNPHSGCYFLNATQMAFWASQPYFFDRDTSFVGPLESAATLGILRAFKIYKPAREHAGFLEIQHCGAQSLGRVGGQLPILDE